MVPDDGVDSPNDQVPVGLVRQLGGNRCPMLWFILVLFVLGFVFGLIARALVPGPDKLSIVGTWFLGIVGSLVGGFAGYALFGADIDDGAVQFGGIVGSILGSVLVLLLYRMMSGRSARRV